MLKETSMEFFQFANNLAGGQADDWSLGFANFIDLLVSMFNLLNPMWWLNKK